MCVKAWLQWIKKRKEKYFSQSVTFFYKAHLKTSEKEAYSAIYIVIDQNWYKIYLLISSTTYHLDTYRDLSCQFGRDILASFNCYGGQKSVAA